MNDERIIGSKVQNVMLENRERMNVSGVIDVINFDENNICINTQLGLLTIKGFDLRLNKLNLENTDLMIEGNIQSLAYTENYEKASFFQKIFK